MRLLTCCAFVRRPGTDSPVLDPLQKLWCWRSARYVARSLARSGRREAHVAVPERRLAKVPLRNGHQCVSPLAAVELVVRPTIDLVHTFFQPSSPSSLSSPSRSSSSALDDLEQERPLSTSTTRTTPTEAPLRPLSGHTAGRRSLPGRTRRSLATRSTTRPSRKRTPRWRRESATLTSPPRVSCTLQLGESARFCLHSERILC